MDGFPTAGGRTTPSALANRRIFGMLFLALRWASFGRHPSQVGPSGNRRSFFTLELTIGKNKII